MRKVTVAAVQMACVPDAAENRRTAETMVRRAAADGAQIILLPELFENWYFCQEKATRTIISDNTRGNPAVREMQTIARDFKVVIPVSYYERVGRPRSTRWLSLTRTARSWSVP
mgnify:CR=1 FL=1